MKEDKQHYNFRAVDAMTSGMYEVFAGCCELLFINQGDDPCTVNQVLLKPYPPGHPELIGSVFSVTCNENELYDGYLDLVFAGTGSAPLVQIVQRFYKLPDR